MFNTVAQILLGIIYGLYLTFLAPATQRQKARNWLKQQATSPTPLQAPTQSPIKASVAESTEQSLIGLEVLEESKLAELAASVTESQESSAAIALGTSCLQTIVITSADLNVGQTVQAKSPRKTKPTQNKQFVAKTQANEVGRAALAKMTVEQLRSLCIERNIKWRNARGGKHLTKGEMLERLAA